jgi:hypothetical protein
MGIGEPLRGIEQRLAGAGPGRAVELAGRGGDLGLHRDLRRVLGGQLGERRGQLGTAGR